MPSEPSTPAAPTGRAVTRHDVENPSALILMLHGGTSKSTAVVDERSASWRRSRWMMTQLQHRAARANTSTWLLRYELRGWNGSGRGPVADARWALDEVRREVGELPVVLLGHSMGGRTAVAAADDPSVVGVVALAPWLEPGERVHALEGRRLAAAHGSRDRITSAKATRAFVDRASGVAASAEFHDMGNVGHYMLRRIPTWNRFALDRSLEFTGADRTSRR